MINKYVIRGVLITLFFGLVHFVLIPVHVPRPSFIPGFAPPPDMWPRVVSLLGMGIGLFSIATAVMESRQATGKTEPVPWQLQLRAETLLRLALVAAVFAGFAWMLPRLGFLGSAILLALATFSLTGGFRYRLLATLLALMLPVLLQLFFANVMYTPFPAGSWDVLPALR
ncbi:tripartite tricarboxylate transporter TctB family protein [Labrenzia sp. VG12]|uniref:tripartite tricarboxylate transporter TctB family protein n=1 Tax=Labrenzia sp. VG12 TaxID=2021862 RepID=UPI000B8C179E|nr:tripartite tricarboxylate transporter TctB family protein [Labrenzia sp. VG12]ASP33579.1 hypothetical protein CHH27_10245 [Labrenzia sp. VG12]